MATTYASFPQAPAQHRRYRRRCSVTRYSLDSIEFNDQSCETQSETDMLKCSFSSINSMRCSTASAPMFTIISEEKILPAAMAAPISDSDTSDRQTGSCKLRHSKKTKRSKLRKVLMRIRAFTRSGSADTSETDVTDDDLRTSTSEMIF